jgi:hypothetical protein
MPDDAVMDTAVEADLDTGLEPSAEPEAPAVEGAETAEPGEPGKAIESAPPTLIEGGKLSADAKKYLDELKTTNPGLARGIQRALYKDAEWQKEVPGGLKEVRELRQTVETLGGPNGVQEIQAEVNGWHQFDAQYMAGDPKAVEFMTSEPEGQEAFLKIIPAALNKFEELHPDGYSQYMAQVFNHTIGQSGIPLALERLGDFLGDNPRAQEQLQKIAGFLKFIDSAARKPVEAPKFAKSEAQPDGRTEFEQERTAFEREKWKNETANAQRPLFEQEWARLAGGRKMSETQQTAIRQLYELTLNKAINGKHSETLQRYFEAKDRNGFLRYAANLDKTEMPKALRAAFEAVLPSRPGPKPGSAPAPVKNGTPAKGLPIAQGFTQVAKQPATQEIDYKNPFNTIANFQQGRAVLKDGKKVQWAKA